MDHKTIFEEYTKASNKMKYVKDKAESLGVVTSDIVCELFKSGYKFDELRRANKGTYNSALKKYEKWKENGSPADEDADALERTEPEKSEPAPSTRVDEENYKPEDYIAHLEKALKEQEEKITELISTNQYLEDNNKIYMDENCQLKAELCQIKAEKAEDSEVMAEHIKANKRMMKRIDELQAEVNEATQNYNEAMLMNKQLESQLALEKADNESESRNLKLAYRENEELRTKVQKCEAFIINQMVYVDHSDFGLKNCCLIDLSQMTEDEKEKILKSQRE